MSTATDLASTLVSPPLAAYRRRKLRQERQDIALARRTFFMLARGEVTPQQLTTAEAELVARYFDGYDRNFKDPMVGEELAIAQAIMARINSGQARPELLNAAQRAVMSRYEELVLGGRTPAQMRDRADDDAGLADRVEDGDSLRGLGQGATDAENVAETQTSSNVAMLGQVIMIAGAGSSAYHGYKRNRSIGWAIWWGFMGALFPIFTVPIAIAQGFGKRA